MNKVLTNSGINYSALILLSFVFLFSFSLVSASPSTATQDPSTCTFIDTVIDLFTNPDCGDNWVGLNIQKTSEPYWKTLKATGDYEVEFKDKNKQKSEICFWSKTATKVQDLPNKLSLYDDKGVEVEKLNRKQDKGKYGYCRIVDTETYLSFNPTTKYEEDSTIAYINNANGLQVNNTIFKHNGVEYITSPSTIWIDSEQGLKFGANDTSLPIINEVLYDQDNNSIGVRNYTKYLYNISSNKEIVKLDNLIYGVNYLGNNEWEVIDLKDVCTQVGSNCEFVLNNNTLEVYFEMDYNETLGMTLIDPQYLTTTYSYASLGYSNTRAEPNDFVHLEINTSSSPYSNLSAYWSFDADSNTNSYDLTNNNNNGVYSGAVNTEEYGFFGKGIYLNGINAFINYSDKDLLDIQTTGFTVSYWQNRTSNAGKNLRAVSKGATLDSEKGWNVFTSDNSALLMIGNGSKRHNLNIVGINAVNNWNHITFTVDSTNITSYLNGEFNATLEHGMILSSLNGNAPFYIGRSTFGNYFSGAIDEVMVFNTALTDAQIQDIYNNQSKRFKDEGNVTFTEAQVNETLGYNIYNITLSPSYRDLNTTLYGRLYLENATSGWYTDPVLVDANLNFGGNTLTSNFTNYTLIVGLKSNTTQANQSFYTPYLNVSKVTYNFTYVKPTNIINVSLINPTNDSVTVSQEEFYVVNHSSLYYDLLNTTYYLWHSNGTLSDTNTTNISGFTNQTNLSLTFNHGYGTYLWNAYTCGADNACFWNSTNFTITYPNPQPPNISFVSPTATSGSMVNRKWIAINVSAESLSLDYILTILYYGNGTQYASIVNGSSVAFNNFTNLEDGLYTYKSWAYDTFGQENSTEERNITLDGNAPDLAIVYPYENTLYSGTGVNMFVSANDSGSGVNGANYSIYWIGNLTGYTHINQSFTANTDNFISLDRTGNVTLTVYVSDMTGSLSSATRHFYFDFDNETSSGGGGSGSTTFINTCRYKKLAYYNTKLTWQKEINCI